MEEADDTSQAVEHYGKTSHDSSDNVEQSETAQDNAGEKSDMDNQEVIQCNTVIQCESVRSNTVIQCNTVSEVIQCNTVGNNSNNASTDTSEEGKRKKTERQPGKADSNRSLGTDEQKYKRLKTTDSTQTDDKKHDQEQDTNADQGADMFEHVKDSDSHHDAQTLDTATAEQQREQGQITQEQEEAESDVDEDLEMQKEESEDIDEKLDTISSTKLKSKQKHDEGNTDASEDEGDMEIQNDHRHEIPGEVVSTSTVARGMESTIHTAMEFLSFDTDTYDLESLRLQLETELGSWSQSNLPVNTDLNELTG
ncbi:hypothetical protein DPMN_054897 [Dreissena polymorpha]|uniref:Uncharacterized protein n=1 Tax=Dreissena polymorpha TaxID=45954 RepID=A0A9D4HRQ7_DREPO|nr:hypothetical protein DPMN_054897 [Dreissena polymorpha]